MQLSMTAPWLKTLDEIEGGDLSLVGGKAFSLATLRRHGLPVPPGLVVTTAFFEAQLRHHQFIPIWAGSPDVAVTESALCWLSDALKISPLARELVAALRTRMAETFRSVESFAVRSSAIDEDTRDHAFSGIHLSELGVPQDMVPVSLSRCWASALSKPALEYRRQHGLPIQSIRLAVLIQPFIQPTTAGVAFTLNPLSGVRDELVVEATFGPGDAVVSGQVTPARYRLAKRSPDYLLLDWTPGNIPHPVSTTKRSRDAFSAGDDYGPLSASQLRMLAQYLEQIEALMAAPQDVEWAVIREKRGGGEKFLFLQTRPITVLPSASASFDVEWSRANHREFLPDLPSPLCVSLLERTQDRALSFFKHLRFNVENTGSYLKIIYGRPYLNLTLARRLLAQSGLNPVGTLWIIGHTEPSDGVGPAYAIDWRQMWEARRVVTGLLLRSLRVETWLNRFERLAVEVSHSLAATDWAKASPSDLLTRFRLRTQLSSRMVEADFVLSAAAVIAYTVAAWALRPLTNDMERFVREAVGTDLKTSGSEQGHALLELAKIARTDEQARRYLAYPHDNFDDYRQALSSTSFLAAFDEFLAQYGKYATFEADLGWPRHREDPLPLLATVAQMTGAEVLPDPQETGTEKPHPGKTSGAYVGRGTRRLASWRPLHSLQMLLSPRRWLTHLSVRRLRRLALIRGQLRTRYGQSMTACRTWDLNLARRWVARGWLAGPEDYFWLTMEEVERALMAEAEVGPTLPALVQARRETYQTYATTEMPYTLRESDVARLVPGRGLIGTALSSVLSGLPVSPGQVQGQVIVLHKPEDSSGLKEGAILVTPSTDPAWFHIFPRARGLIVEMGGLLSHGSIIAREFGLPAVANIPDATSRFHDGDLVLLDGSTGLVQILDPATTDVSTL
jgi:phosphoenolpyruvate synthase/pyruvate phosphate dikinase